MDADNWSTLPDDLFVDIVRRLNVTAVVRCAGACRPWRRAIINNASCFRPRPDRFLPGLLLGFLESQLDGGNLRRKPQYVPASTSTVPFLLPAAGVCVDGRLYSDLLSSRDGFLLLGDHNGTSDCRLCLFTAHTGNFKVLPAAEIDNGSMRCMYVLATGYDVMDDFSRCNDGDQTTVWILAVDWHPNGNVMTYQIFSSTAGVWGPVKCSAKIPKNVVANVLTSPLTPSVSVVVCHSAVTWLVYAVRNTNIHKCLLSFDLRTERTWTTELPCVVDTTETPSFVLAVSEDGRLCLVRMLLSSNQMEVWVLVGDGQWTLRRIIDEVQKLLPDCPRRWVMQWLSGFCPRSGYLFGTGIDDMGFKHHFLTSVDGSSPRLIERDESRSSESWFPYEMDSSKYISSYISKMDYF